MSNSTPTFGTLGTLSMSLRQEIGDNVQIDPGTSALALLADGSASVELDAIKQALSEGKSVTVAGPSDAVARELGSLAGGGAPLGAALVTLHKGSKGYQMSVTPRGALTELSATDSGPNGEAKTTSLAIGPSLASVSPHFQPPIDRHAAPAAMAMMQGQPGGLTPPTGSYAGYSYFPSNLPWTISPPTGDNGNDDRTIYGNTQSLTNNCRTEFYVYWVNGTGNNGSGVPYYVVILKQTGTMSAGNVLATNGNSRGWFQYGFSITPNSIVNSNTKQPFDPSVATVTALSHSPASGGLGPVPISLNIPMTCWASVQGGIGPNQFTATVNDSLSLPDWDVQDKTSGIDTSWMYNQHEQWDPVLFPVSDFGSWFQNMYDNYGHVIQMTTGAMGDIQFEAVSAWRFDSPSFQNLGSAPAPASLGVGFNGGWNQSVAVIHNTDGCLGLRHHHHLFYNTNGWGWGWYIDLGGIARQQNIP